MSTKFLENDNPEITTESEAEGFLSKVKYRTASPTDILKCVEMVKLDSNPNRLFASRNDLQYRQHYAAPYFRCAVYQDEQHKNDEDNIIGFITGIRLELAENDYKTLGSVLTNIHPHDPVGKVLVIRSVVIGEEYRGKGLGKAMIKDYIQTMRHIAETSSSKSSQIKPILKIVGLCWGQGLLTFYLNCGFSIKKADQFTQVCTMMGQNKQLQSAYYFESSIESPLDCGVVANKNENKCYIVDSFASAPGTGNPAAVVLLSEDCNPEMKRKWMQKVAAEFNLSETAFCWPNSSRTPRAKKESHWNIRYFTPTVEIGLCGHATLAAAAILYQTLSPVVLPPNTAVVFHATEDILTMNLEKYGQKDTIPSQRTSKISMEFPAKPTVEISTQGEITSVRNMLKNAFFIELTPLYIGLSDIGDLLIELPPEEFGEIGYDSLNFKAFFEWGGYHRGIVICCLASEPDSDVEIDFLSRFFAPKAGINEDPVTGSAHCSLGPYFAKKLKKSKVVGCQMSMRGGLVICEVFPSIVRLTGTAITTMNGNLIM